MNANYYNFRYDLQKPKWSYPTVAVTYILDKDGHGYTASMELWETGDGPIRCKHELWIRQVSPMGHLTIIFDGFEHGCWASIDVSGATLTERDLEWAGAWAVECMRRKHAMLEDVSCRIKELASEVQDSGCPQPLGTGKEDRRVH